MTKVIIGTYTIEVKPDPDMDNPRQDNKIGTIAFFGRTKGDKHDWASPADLQAYLRNKQQVISLPVYMLDHSGRAFSTHPFNDPWDSGQIGWIYVERKDYYAAMGCKRATRSTIEGVLRFELKLHAAWINGEYVRYVVKDGEGHIVDSCGGFLSEREAIAEARDANDLGGGDATL